MTAAEALGEPSRFGGPRGSAALPSWLITAALAVAWLVAGPSTADLAAQVHRVGAFAAQGFTIWDNTWYAGHHVPDYSLTFPAVGSVLGVRPAGALAAVLSAIIFEALAGERTSFATRAWFAVGCAADLLIGRLTYATGVMLGLAAVMALVRCRPVLAAGLASACAATSPVAGVFLALTGVGIAIAQRRAAGLVTAGVASAIVLAMAVAFPEGGSQPFSASSFLVTLSISAVATALVAHHAVLRWPLLLYLVTVVVAFAVPSPLGGNVTRFGTAFVAPALLAVVPGADPRRRAVLIVVLCAAAAWQWIDPLTQAARGWEDPSSQASYYQPLLAHLPGTARGTYRVEVPFTRGHWETVYLARKVALARGWERQLDRRLNSIFYRRRLDSRAYHGWLRSNAVRFVAVPDVAMDDAGRQEAQIVRSATPYLRPVWAGAHWRLFEVTDPVGLASPRAAWAQLTAQAVHVAVRRPGRVLLRVHWTPYWHLTRGAGCLSKHRGWTMLQAARPGTFVLAPRFSIGRFFEQLPPCGAAG